MTEMTEEDIKKENEEFFAKLKGGVASCKKILYSIAPIAMSFATFGGYYLLAEPLGYYPDEYEAIQLGIGAGIGFFVLQVLDALYEIRQRLRDQESG